ncbi:MAG: VOC family protein [Alphaproteobacteria bacterium]|nr:VOC family protein [Alphaproteobacteria bacterium]
MTLFKNQITAFHVSDMQKALDYYVGVLGFTKDWEWQHAENFPVFASVSHGEHTLYLTEHRECAPGGLVYLYFDSPQDVDLRSQFIQEKGGTTDFGPIDQAWMLREVQVSDPFGNKIRFCARLPAGGEK